MVFVDGRKLDAAMSEEEEEANRWATEFLIPTKAFAQFIEAEDYSVHAVREFFEKVGIAPGIVVGQLQNRGLVAYSKLNELKDRFDWA